MNRRLIVYKRVDGRQPYEEWLENLSDTKTQDRIEARVLRVAEGNAGDHRGVGNGVMELRLNFGPGYRVYYGEDGPVIVVLLVGGDKSSQNKDIALAKDYWADYKENKQ